jgi:hypothetical protein
MAGDRSIHSGIIRCGNDQKNTFEMLGLVFPLDVLDLAFPEKGRHILLQLRANDSDCGPERQQRTRLTLGDVSTAYDEAVLFMKIKINGEIRLCHG